MTKWPFANRKLSERVVLNENSVSFQWVISVTCSSTSAAMVNPERDVSDESVGDYSEPLT